MFIAGNKNMHLGRILTLVIALICTACAAEQTPEMLIIGDWSQIESVPVTDEGVTLEISESQARYLTDGTSITSSIMEIDNVPDELATYRLDGKGTWRIENGMLFEQVSQINVRGTDGNPQAASIAKQMEQTITSAGESQTEILALSNDLMTLKNTETGLILRFEKK